MLPVEKKADRPTGEGDAGSGGGDHQGIPVPDQDPLGASPAADPIPPAVLLPGPLAGVRLTPSTIRVECMGTRRVRAVAHDAAGSGVNEHVSFEWSLSGGVGRIAVEADAPERVVLEASSHPAEGIVRVVALSGSRRVEAEAVVEVVEEIASARPDEGIPEPELVDEPSSPWRSRIHEGRWQVNVGHPEYRAVADKPALKLRLLAMLFAKEIVLRSTQDPRLDRPLEQLVEVAAYADRNLADRRGRRSRRKQADD